MQTKIIQLELNEVSKAIIDKLIAKGKLKNFKYINSRFQYVTTVSDAKYENIEPWIQWVSAHTGKTYAEHQVLHLGDIEKLEHPQIWETLHENGMKSAIFGSMNVKQGAAKDGMFFPDPWAKDGKTSPSELQPLWDLVASKVQTHATAKLNISDIVKGLKCCLKYKIPLGLYIRIAKQIIVQKFNPKKKWKMPALFDELLSGIFLTILKKTDFSYYTLFLNACAHYQHHYWREFAPDLFRPDIHSPDIDKGDDPISYGYESYDRILGAIVDYVQSRKDVLLIIATAFTQEPYVKMESQGGMNYYRLNDHQGFLNNFMRSGAIAHPMMSRDWQVNVSDCEQLEGLQVALSQLTVSGESLFSVQQNSQNALFIYTALTRQVEDGEFVMWNNKSLGVFGELFTNIAIKSGHHICEGSLWLSSRVPDFDLYNGISLTKLYDLNKCALGIAPLLDKKTNDKAEAAHLLD